VGFIGLGQIKSKDSWGLCWICYRF